MEPIPLFTAASGLNTKLDPVRLRYNAEAGVSDLASAINVNIDNTGRVSRRQGYDLKTAGEHHSIWCDGGDCFLIEETASYGSIMRVASDLSVSGIRSGLTKDKRMSFVDVNDITFYSNGFENGQIINGVSSAWPEGTYSGPSTNRNFSPAPIGQHLAFYMGRIIIAVGNVIWFTEPYSPGMVDKTRMFWQFSSDVRMIKPMDKGVFISDSRATYYLDGSSPHDFIQKRIATYPAHEWSSATEYVELDDLDLDEKGEGAIWSSPEGICIGLPSGRIRNLTKERLDYPKAYTKGASLICGYHVINTMY